MNITFFPKVSSLISSQRQFPPWPWMRSFPSDRLGPTTWLFFDSELWCLFQFMNFQMSKLDLEKAEEPEIKLPTSARLSKKQQSSRKTSTFAVLTTPKSLTVWITTNCGKFFKRLEYQTTLWACSQDRAHSEKGKRFYLAKNEVIRDVSGEVNINHEGYEN